MNDDAFGIRPGEVKTELPEKFDAGVYFIGRVHTPWTRREQCPKNARESDAVCTIEVDRRVLPVEDAKVALDHCLDYLQSNLGPDAPVIHARPCQEAQRYRVERLDLW